jgi:hypothetical protein
MALLAATLTGCGGGGNAPAPLPPNVAGATSATAVVAGPGESPRSADAFVDAAGVNVHLAYSGTLYGNGTIVTSVLAALGVRHIRDGTAPTQSPACTQYARFAAAGIHLDLITSPSLDRSALNSWISCLGPSLEAIEGPNEYDASGDPNWAAVLESYMQVLNATAKPAVVIAPVLVSEEHALAVGSLASSVSDGNMHDYFAGRNPGTSGWGGTDAYGTYGSLAFNMQLAGITSGNKPVIATETGYSDSADQYAVPAATKARYIMRALLEHWNAGVVRTYLYELIDEGGEPFSHYGLVDAAGTPKPAYTALKNLLARLSDPGGATTLAPLDYTIAAPSFVHHTLLQKRNGAYALVLWVELPEWDPNQSAPIAVAPQSVKLVFAHAPASAAATVFGDGGDVSTSGVSIASNAATVHVSASPTIVDIVP